MEEETKTENKEAKKEDKENTGEVEKAAEAEKEAKHKDEKKEDKKTDDKKKKEKIKQVIKKSEAVARGVNLHISKKQGMYICSFIKGKSIDGSIRDLEQVIKMKKAVPFKGEIPHRKGMMSGRYPVKASKIFIDILKSLKGNIIVNGLELEKSKIYFASASAASRPMKTGGRRAKRTNLIIKAKEISEDKK